MRSALLSIVFALPLSAACAHQTTGAGLASDRAQPHGGLYSSETDDTDLPADDASGERGPGAQE